MIKHIDDSPTYAIVEQYLTDPKIDSFTDTMDDIPIPFRKLIMTLIHHILILESSQRKLEERLYQLGLADIGKSRKSSNSVG